MIAHLNFFLTLDFNGRRRCNSTLQFLHRLGFFTRPRSVKKQLHNQVSFDNHTGFSFQMVIAPHVELHWVYCCCSMILGNCGTNVLVCNLFLNVVVWFIANLHLSYFLLFGLFDSAIYNINYSNKISLGMREI